MRMDHKGWLLIEKNEKEWGKKGKQKKEDDQK